MIWDYAQKKGDDLTRSVAGPCYPPGVVAHPLWNYLDDEYQEGRDHTIACLLEVMKCGLKEQEGYNKLKEITQGSWENPA